MRVSMNEHAIYLAKRMRPETIGLGGLLQDLSWAFWAGCHQAGASTRARVGVGACVYVLNMVWVLWQI